MAHIEGDITIGRPVAEVFDFVADERNEPSYNPRMIRATKATPGPVGAGTVFRARAMTMGRPVDMTTETTGYERPARIDSSTALSFMDVHGTLTFEPVPGGTRMRWSWEVRPRGALRLLAPLIARLGDRQERVVWAGLKRLLEDRAHPAAAAAG